jgi:SanA protein
MPDGLFQKPSEHTATSTRSVIPGGPELEESLSEGQLGSVASKTRAAPVGRRLTTWLARTVMLVVACLTALTALNSWVILTTRSAMADTPAAVQAHPWAIVLGNYVSPDGIPSPELWQRLETARSLYASGRAGRLVASGMHRPGYDEPHGMAAWLVAHGVPPNGITLDLGGHRTAATVANASRLGVRSVLIVTQAYHLPRALYFARHAGLDAVGVVAPLEEGLTAEDLFRRHGREIIARAACVIEVALFGVRS